MKLSEIQQAIKTAHATVCVGTFLLAGTERRAVLCADDDHIVAIVCALSGHIAPAVFEQRWDWCGAGWQTSYLDELEDAEGITDPDGLYSLIAGECPRCHGAGVIEELERQGPFLVPALNPCPVCVRREDPPLPF